MIEVEQKFRVTSLSELCDRLLQTGFRSLGRQVQADIYFQHPARNFAQTDEAFRLRQQGEAWMVTYKGPKAAGPCKQRYELELPLVNQPTTESDWTTLLEKLGFHRVAAVRKLRETWTSESHPGYCITIDQLEMPDRSPSVKSPYFCEIECVVEGPTETAVKGIEALACQLDLKEIETNSYLELILAEPHASPG